MFSRIVVALNDLPESQRALRTALDLARSLNASLTTVSVLGDLPAFSSFAAIVDPAAPLTLKEDLRNLHGSAHEKAKEEGRRYDVEVKSAILDGSEVHAMLRFLSDEKADLLVLGLHQHDFYVSRLWNSVYDLAQGAHCSVLGVH
jgi:nucleotide-binding universal stress UspA family protein